MIHCVEIKGLTEKDIIFAEMTTNTIVLCQNSDLKYKLAKEFDKIMIGEADKDGSNVIYSTNDMEEVGMRVVSEYKPTTIYEVNNSEQRIILTVEATSILNIKCPEDLWFFGELDDTGGVRVYALTEFMNYEKTWEEYGIQGIYRNTVNGRYGTYEGYGR